MTFQVAKNYFNVFPHGLVTFQKVTNLSGMLAHTNKSCMWDFAEANSVISTFPILAQSETMIVRVGTKKK